MLQANNLAVNRQRGEKKFLMTYHTRTILATWRNEENE